jgi:hypothetical protein
MLLAQSRVADGPGHILAALRASGALPPASPVPGQLAGLCTRMGNPGHGIAAPPAADLPDPWHSMLTRPAACRRRGPAPLGMSGRDHSRAARAGRRPHHDPRPAPRRCANHRAHAGQRRHARGRLDPRQGSPATADAAGSRQQRPLTRHPHPWRGPVTEQRRGHRVASDRAPAGQRHPLDRCGRHRPIGRGPDQAAALLEVKPLKRSLSSRS